MRKIISRLIVVALVNVFLAVSSHAQMTAPVDLAQFESKAVLAKELGATHIALAGAATNWCIRATAYGALDRGYDLTLIEDAHTTGAMELDNGTRIEASNVIDELNACMTWVSYPGRANATATAEEVDFAALGGKSER